MKFLPISILSLKESENSNNYSWRFQIFRQYQIDRLQLPLYRNEHIAWTISKWRSLKRKLYIFPTDVLVTVGGINQDIPKIGRLMASWQWQCFRIYLLGNPVLFILMNPCLMLIAHVQIFFNLNYKKSRFSNLTFETFRLSNLSNVDEKAFQNCHFEQFFKCGSHYIRSIFNWEYIRNNLECKNIKI